MGYNTDTILKLRKLRLNMGSELYFEDAKRIFKSNVSFLKRGGPSEASLKKIEYAKENVKMFVVGNLVKFVGITGSVGAGIAKENDDIDVMIVVKNGLSWWYRGLLLLKNLKNKKFRFANQQDVENIFCPNMIIEERGLVFEDDLFIFHELFFLKPIFNPEYLNAILNKNGWIKKWGAVVEKTPNLKEKRNMFFELINFPAFLLQYLYMRIRKHKPDFKRLFKNYRKGKIEFYPSDFKTEVLKKL